jgi:serine phosphatase RsbU (regulator of sigma subunit)
MDVRTGLRQRRGLAIATVYGLLVAIFVARLLIDEPGLGLPYLAVFPIVLACFLLGRVHALVCATLGIGIFLATQWLAPTGDVSNEALLIGTIGRAAVFYGLALVVCDLLERETLLRQRLADSERELRELESLRAALTPRELPDLEGLEVATSYTPAEGLAAGDFYLVTKGPRGTALVVLADVVGHGLQAARQAAFVRTTIALFADYTDDPLTILRLANTALAERDPATEYVTAVCASIDPVRQTVTWATAGHPPPWDLDRAEPLDGHRPGPPLGVEPVLDCTPTTTRLDAGAGLLLYTDGLTEARTARRVARHELFGEDGARAALRTLQGAEPADIVAGLSAAAVRHAEGRPADDLCLVAVRMIDPALRLQAA